MTDRALIPELAAERELDWKQPQALHRRFELTDGDRLVASLDFESRCGSRATGQFGANRWTFKRTGFLSPKISVRMPGSDADLAVFAPGWMGSGWVTFQTGKRYHLRHTNFWGTEWVFEAEDGTPAVSLSGRQGLFKQGGVATIASAAAGSLDTPILLLLIWYVRVLMHEDAAAGAAVAAVS